MHHWNIYSKIKNTSYHRCIMCSCMRQTTYGTNNEQPKVCYNLGGKYYYNAPECVQNINKHLSFNF